MRSLTQRTVNARSTVRSTALRFTTPRSTKTRRRSLLPRVLAAAVLATTVGVASSNPFVPTASADNTPWRTPTVPPKCTASQVDSGNVAGCVVTAGTAAPYDRGWGTPPFPATVSGAPFPPAGWTWNGYTYNGSSALSTWETRFAKNAATVGSIGPNKLLAPPEALALFEGFLRELHSRGYNVVDGYTYSFRCVASATRNCRGLTINKLSNHAYGLAVDLNAGANPLRTYYRVNGVTACKTPMVTDFPQWAIQVAEKWGLYWGGYGWSSGCSSPNQDKDSATRDPHHFEFNGTPAQARAILAFNGAPRSCVETVDTAGVVVPRCYLGFETPAAGTRLRISTGAPSGTSAALVNLTTTGTLSNGYLTAEDCAARPNTTRAWSNMNQRVGMAIAAVAAVPVDAQGRFCVYINSPTQVIVDVQGFFAPSASAASGALYVPVGATTVVDTASSGYCLATGCVGAGAAPANSELIVPASGVPSGAVAAVAALGMVNPVSRGFMTAGPCSTLTPGPQSSSNVNALAGSSSVNAAFVGVEADSANGGSSARWCTTQNVATDAFAVLQGYFQTGAAGGLGFAVQTPTRLVDSRGCWTPPGGAQVCDTPIAAGGVVTMQAPAGASVVALNVTVTQAAGQVGATAGPCDALPAAGARPFVWSAANEVRSSLVLVPVDAQGRFCVQVQQASAHVVVDQLGVFSTAGPLRYVHTQQNRRLDTRPA